MTLRRSLKLQICGALLLLSLVWICSPAFGAAEDDSKGQRVLVPHDLQKIGEGGDTLCPATKKYCNKIRAEGQVPAGTFAFFAVEPVLTSPKVWIQPLISGMRKDGTFSGLINLGEEGNGPGEYFKIYVLACKDKDHLEPGPEPDGLPKDCLASEPVEVFRTR